MTSLVSMIRSVISLQSVQNSYLELEASSGPISFEVQWNDVWTDNIQSFELPLSSTALGARAISELTRLKFK